MGTGESHVDGRNGTPSGQDAPTTGSHAVASITLADLGVRLDIPTVWESVEVGDPRVALAARQPASSWFRVNVTVSVDHEASSLEPADLAATTAAYLRDAVVVQAGEHPGGGPLVVVLHRVDHLDLVVTQRSLPGPAGLVVASWTWALEQEPAWRAASTGLVNSFARIAAK